MLAPVAAKADWINRTFADIDEIGGKDIDAQVNNVLECIVHEGLQHILSVDRIHKHYDLLDGELPTYSAMEGDFKKQIIRPLPVNDTAFPLSFALTDGGLVTISVLEAASVPEVLRTRMSTVLGEKSGAFVKVVSLIRALKMEPFIGLSFRTDNFTDSPFELHFNEKSYIDRVQTLTAYNRATDPIEGKHFLTSWFTSCAAEELAARGPIVRACQSSHCHATCSDGHHSSHTWTGDP
jgi:hypothetical protein